MSDMSLNVSFKKRKADVLGRLSESSASSGRGASAGWTTCPLCGRHSQKKFALGRGIAAHLHAVHTPWKPGKIERKKKRRLEQRSLAEAARRHEEASSFIPESNQTNDEWIPTEQQIDEWNQKVLKIITELEAQAVPCADGVLSVTSTNHITQVHMVAAGLDRNGSKSKDYRESLPEFLRAAAEGNLSAIQKMYKEAKNSGGKASVINILHTRDRHLSTAEHWAAGNGHLSCLQWILAKQREYLVEETSHSAIKMRRRDGKTALHYAARNGHLPCIQYLVEECDYEINSVSGDGTTPFHLACFGAHLDVARYLLRKGGDQVARISNDWKCSPAHWVAMTKNDSIEQVIRFCEFLKTEVGVSFVTIQKQGHSPLHKAAQVSLNVVCETKRCFTLKVNLTASSY
jgi:ankyrin repeat protein